MKAALSTHGLTQLILRLRLESDYATALKIWQSAGLNVEEDEEGLQAYAFAGFRTGRKDHTVFVALRNLEGGDMYMTLIYDLEDEPLEKTGRDNFNKLVSFVEELDSPCNVIAQATIEYSTSHVKPLFTLPLVTFNMPDSYFDAIRGIRLVRSGDKQESDVVTIDLMTDDLMRLYVETTYQSTLSAALPSQALKRLVAIKSHAVTEIR